MPKTREPKKEILTVRVTTSVMERLVFMASKMGLSPTEAARTAIQHTLGQFEREERQGRKRNG